MNNKVTMGDIAVELGISTVAVSKALSGKNGVSDELRKNILETAKKLGYRKKEKNKKEKKLNTIGVIVASRFLIENRSYYWRLYQEVTIAANKKHYYTLLEVIDEESEHSKVEPKLMKQGGLVGMIVLGSFDKGYIDNLNMLSKKPLIALDSVYEQIKGDAVTADNIEGAYRVTEYIIQSGHKRIGYVGTLKTTPSIDDRYMGFCKAMFFYGLEINESWIINDRDIKSGKVDDKGCFILPEDMPEAFFCNSDLSARILMEKLLKKGYKVPEDISVAGFDNYLPDGKVLVPLTTYEADVKGMAGEAVELISERMNRNDRPCRVVSIRGKLIEGKSVRKRQALKS